MTEENNVSIFHHFYDTTTFTVYATACFCEQPVINVARLCSGNIHNSSVVGLFMTPIRQ